MVTDGQSLIRFDSASPGTLTTVAVTGMQAGETLVGIDFRPSNGVLYGLGNTKRLYALNFVTGAATPIGPVGTYNLNGGTFGRASTPSTMSFTAIVSGADGGTGVGLVETYDLSPDLNSKLANIATRGFVQTGDDIAGTIVVGQVSQRVVVRAIGPSLPLAGKLENPILELRDGNGSLLAENDNWRDTQEVEIVGTGLQPTNDLESAIVRVLPPALYTAVLRGVNGTIGIAVVEVYAIN